MTVKEQMSLGTNMNRKGRSDKKREVGRKTRRCTYMAFASSRAVMVGLVGLAELVGSGDSDVIVTKSSVHTMISGAMSSEEAESCRVVFRAAPISDRMVVGDDTDLAELESEVRVERRESSALTPLRRPRPGPLDCRVRALEEFPILSVCTTGHSFGYVAKLP
jgi:hypothetical protein